MPSDPFALLYVRFEKVEGTSAEVVGHIIRYVLYLYHTVDVQGTMKYEISATSVVRLDRYNSAASAGNQPQHIVVCSVYSVQYFCILFFI